MLIFFTPIIRLLSKNPDINSKYFPNLKVSDKGPLVAQAKVVLNAIGKLAQASGDAAALKAAEKAIVDSHKGRGVGADLFKVIANCIFLRVHDKFLPFIKLI